MWTFHDACGMAESSLMILYAAWHIEQWHRVVRFAVKVTDFYRKQWWVDQWFNIALSFHYTDLLSTTTYQNSLTKYSAIWPLLKCCEYMHEYDGVLYYFMHWVVISKMSFVRILLDKTTISWWSLLIALVHQCAELLLITIPPNSITIYSATRNVG